MLKRPTSRIGGSALVGAALVASALTSPAAALAPENPFTADAAPTWQTNGTVWAMASAQGKVFAGGGFTTVRAPGTAELDASTLNRSSMVVLDAATGVPTDCMVEVGLGTANGSVRSVAASPDGSTIYLGGSFSKVNNVFRSNVAAVDAATCTVLPFNPGASSFVHAITATATKVYFGGTFTSFGKGAVRTRLAATTPAGDLLPWAPTAEDAILGLAVDPTNGNVVLGGRMDLVNGQDSHDLAVVDGVNGTLVRAYPAPFFPYSPGDGQRQGNTAIKTVTSDSTGFYIGAEGTGYQLFDGRAAFNWGTYDQRWRDTCLGATQALAVHRGVLFSGHHMHDCETEGMFEDGARHHMSAQSTSGEEFVPWWPNSNGGKGEALGPRSMTVAKSGDAHYLWYGGEFTTINGQPQQGLTRFAESPDTGAPGTPKTPNLTSTSAGEVRVMVRTTDDTDDAKLTYYLYRGTGTTPIATLNASSQFYDHPQVAFTDTGLTPGSSQSYRVRAFDGTNYSAYSAAKSITVASSSNAYANQVVTDGATEYFRMEEASGNAAGSNGSSTLGGTYAGTSTRAGQPGALVSYPGTSALFDGTSSFLRTDSRKTLPAGYSVELWFNTTSTAGGRLIGYGNKALINGTPQTPPNSTKIDRNVYLGPDGKLVFGALTSTNGVASLASTASYNDGRWHHVVATHGAAGMTLYADGVKIGSNSVASTPSPSGYWRIGGDGMPGTWPNEPTTGFFAGNIDEAAVYPTVLTATQVTNHHTLSGPAPAPTPAPTPTVETLPAKLTADSYAASATPTKTSGTELSLLADGSPATNSYLRFTLPAAPTGKTLTGAKLQVRTTSSTSAGSPGTYAVALSGNTWTETGLTYNNRPATGTSLGSLTASAANTTYTSTLSVAALKPLLGSETSMVISSTSTDGISLLSRENTTTSSHPQLLLTFS